MAELVVSDHGPGFPPEIIARVFEPYVTTKARGTGLGLAIVKKIVDEHHGRISINNRQPVGAEVSILLPLAALPNPARSQQTFLRGLTWRKY
jgi:nitrogen fixation/metabolism regulation signal transduction histidine kinase